MSLISEVKFLFPENKYKQGKYELSGGGDHFFPLSVQNKGRGILSDLLFHEIVFLPRKRKREKD